MVVRAGIEFASIKFSIRQSQPPGRLKEGRVVNPPAPPTTVTHCRKRLYVSSANVRRREHLSGYRSRQARVGATGASGSRLETIRNRAKQVLSVQFGAILELIVSFLRLIAQTMRRRLTPRSRLRRRRIAEFELAKPRIHPAEFYGGNEDDSRRSSTRSYPSLETMTGNLGQVEADWWRPVSESSLLLTEPIHGVGAGRLTAF